MRLLSCLIFSVSVLCMPVMAQTQAADPAAPPSKDDKKEMICVDRNPTANTRVNSQRVCRTREEWEKRGGIPK